MQFYYYFIKFKIFLPLIKLISHLYKNKINFKNKDFDYRIDEKFDNISKFLMFHDLYEKIERRLIKFLDDDLDVIEAGGGIGLISMYIKQKIKNKKLIILEPNERLNNIIKNNFKINNFTNENFILLNYALSDETDQIVNFQKFESSMANTISKEVLDYNFKKTESTKVKTLSINEIIKKFNLKDFQLVLDIEGAELDVLTKNNDWLLNCKKILLENHFEKERLNYINNYLLQKKFQLIKKNENVFLFSK